MTSVCAENPVAGAARRFVLRTLEVHIGQSLEVQEDLGLVYIKIANLRRVNNTLGYEAGDAVLQGVQARLESLMRQKDLLARIGDSEFVLILSSLMGEGHAILAANKILRRATDSLIIGEAEVGVQIVLGVSLLSSDTADAETLLANAEAAMLTAVAQDLDYTVYSSPMGRERGLDWALDEGIQEAIENRQIELVYQPRVCLQSGEVTGVEILMQWMHPEYGVIPPPALRQVAERTGKITQLTWWALKACLRSANGWPEPWDRLPVAVNLSKGMLCDPELAPLVLSAVSLCGVSPYCLTVEISQELALRDPSAGSGSLQRLRDAGVGVCIDAFGMGCGSLDSFKQFPVDELKIHGSFVARMREDRHDRLIVKSLVQLAHNFGLKIGAEGVSSAAAAELLSELGCDYAQGLCFAAPMLEEELLAWLVGRDPMKSSG